jgi:hypothetical protein
MGEAPFIPYSVDQLIEIADKAVNETVLLRAMQQAHTEGRQAAQYGSDADVMLWLDILDVLRDRFNHISLRNDPIGAWMRLNARTATTA